MKEVEVKAKVENLVEVEKKLTNLGCAFSQPAVQKDSIFVNSEYGDFGEFQPSKNVLRIRESDGKYLFTLKQPQSNELDCIEKEFEINDPNQLRSSLELMGYAETVRVVKTRKKAKYRGYEICLDKVEKLGDFIEIESITDKDPRKVQEDMFDFLKSLGVRDSDRVTRGYDTLVWLKNKS